MSQKIILAYNPEFQAGGYTKRNGTHEFYQRVNALIRPDMHVLDFGAGRGVQHEQPGGQALYLKGRVEKIVGCDVDPVVSENETLDEAVQIKPGEPLPFADNSFDLIFADWVLEHIEYPEALAGELRRILKSGGWFCARTPSRFSYIALSAVLIPERFHDWFLKRVQPGRKEMDVFPKHYRMNTRGAIAKAFPQDRFLNASYTFTPDPAYHGGKKWLYRLIDLYQALPVDALKTVLMVFVQKR